MCFSISFNYTTRRCYSVSIKFRWEEFSKFPHFSAFAFALPFFQSFSEMMWMWNWCGWWIGTVATTIFDSFCLCEFFCCHLPFMIFSISSQPEGDSINNRICSIYEVWCQLPSVASHFGSRLPVSMEFFPPVWFYSLLNSFHCKLHNRKICSISSAAACRAPRLPRCSSHLIPNPKLFHLPVQHESRKSAV